MIKDSSGATSRTLSPPVHLQQPVAALSLAEEGGAQRCGGEIRKEETRCAHKSWTYSLGTVMKAASVKVELFLGFAAEVESQD